MRINLIGNRIHFNLQSLKYTVSDLSVIYLYLDFILNINDLIYRKKRKYYHPVLNHRNEMSIRSSNLVQHS